MSNTYKNDWNKRAREDARGYAASLDHETEEKFVASGIRDGSLLFNFSGLESGKRHPRVLEIGCGIGRLLQYMANHFEELWGADVSSEMLGQARERLDGAGFENRSQFLEVEGNGRIPTEQTFDLIYSYTVFQHIRRRDTWKYIAETARLLAPNGVAVLHFVEPFGLRRNLQALFHIDPGENDTLRFRYFRRAEVEKRCARNGLKIEDHRKLDFYGLYRIVKA